MIEIGVADVWQMQMEKRADKAFLLIVLLKELLTEPAFFGGKIENFLVVHLAVEVFGKHSSDDSASAAELSPHINDNSLAFHKSILYVVG